MRCPNSNLRRKAAPVSPLNRNRNRNLPLSGEEKAGRLRLRLRGSKKPSPLVQPIIGIGPDQPYQHRNDSVQGFFSCQRHAGGALAFRRNYVQRGGAFQTGTSCNIKKPASVRSGKLPITLRQVQSNGSAGAIQLITSRQRLRQPLQERLKPRDKGQTPLVNLKLFVIEQCSHRIKETLLICESDEISFYPKVKSIFPLSFPNPNRNRNLPSEKTQRLRLRLRLRLRVNEARPPILTTTS